MALRTSEEDTRLNPGQADTDRKVSRDTARSLSEAEKESLGNIEDNFDKNADSTDEDSNIKKLQEKENSDGGWNNNFTGAAANSSKSGGRFKFTKGKGATAAIISLIFGAGFGFSALFSPGLLIVQMKEIMVDKFNTQLSSMDARTDKILNLKINQSTTGLCGTLTVKCKYATMSAKQVANFKAAGIEVSTDKPLSFGRTKPTSYNYNGKEIKPADFSKIVKSDPGFRSALNNAYNPKFAGFYGKAWRGTAAHLGVSKAPLKPAANDEGRASRLNDETKNGMRDVVAKAGDLVNSSCTGDDCAKITAADAEKINAAAEEARTNSTSGTKSGTSALKNISTAIEGGANTVGNFFKITGVADYACQAYGSVQAVGYAAKTIRAAQLARYAMAFVKTADMIKAGTATPEDVAYMGGILTEVTYDVSSTTRRVTQGAATDSFGYKFAAYGDTSANKNSMNLASQFLAGGGLTGDLINFSSTIKTAIGGDPRGTCAFLGNPWVGAGSAAIGIAFMLIPGVGQSGQLLKTIAQGAAGVAIQIGLAVLPELMKDIVAGVVTENISGEESGNAITSGAGKIMSDTLAGLGGNAMMTKEDAIAYNSLQTDTLAKYAEDDRLALSPFDATNRNTFLGSIVFQLLPQTSNMSSISGSLSALGNIISGSLTNIVPKTNALSSAEYAESLDVCQDYDYQELGIAVDPFCNIIRGIPPQYLDKDPLAVIDSLSGQINTSTGEPTGDYASFVKNCIENVNPPGYTEGAFQEATGEDCIIDSSNADYYLYWIDQRVEAGMSGEDTSINEPQTTIPSMEKPDNVQDQHEGWTLKPGANYSDIACDPRTEDKGVVNAAGGSKIRICAVHSSSKYPAYTGGNEYSVSSLVSTNVVNMFEAAHADGVTIGITSGYRSTSGTQHGRGLAMDLGAPRGGASICHDGGTGNKPNWDRCFNRTDAHGKAFKWLNAHAAEYGFYNLDGPSHYEPWHWSTSGY